MRCCSNKCKCTTYNKGNCVDYFPEAKGEEAGQAVRGNDFRVGDKVFDDRFGNGVVVREFRGGEYPVRVAFEKGARANYTVQGFLLKSDRYRSLFHGHDLEPIKEKLPVRTKVYWMYIYIDRHRGMTTSSIHVKYDNCMAAMRDHQARGCQIVKGPFEIEL